MDHNIDGESEEDEDRELFSSVMASIRLDLVPGYASTVRRKINHDNEHQELEPHLPLLLGKIESTVTIGSPLFGSYHVLFPVRFSNGVRWLLKVPSNGTRDRFDESAARALRSEALTMRLLKSLYVWFDKISPKDVVQARRTRVLREIAEATVQLDEFSFEKGGLIVFDEYGQPVGIGPLRDVDREAMLDRLSTGDDTDNTPTYVESGPFTDPKSFYTAPLDRRSEPGGVFSKGELKLLRMFISWIPEPEPLHEYGKGKKKPFALIDWDGICAVPRSLGNERYPSWLTRDWDPAMYGWKEEMEQEGFKPEGVWEDSKLAFYRALYDGFMRSCLLSRQDVWNTGTRRNWMRE
ncbi:hypothetical protein VTN00DRAFT_8138 [Thermoascus crustaceus]|uniref:uncharacterized protein n=1 Tax=Thermoascus crustaceus TaxID=5088 RepID=UPI003743E987